MPLVVSPTHLLLTHVQAGHDAEQLDETIVKTVSDIRFQGFQRETHKRVQRVRQLRRVVTVRVNSAPREHRTYIGWRLPWESKIGGGSGQGRFVAENLARWPHTRTSHAQYFLNPRHL